MDQNIRLASYKMTKSKPVGSLDEHETSEKDNKKTTTKKLPPFW